MADEAKIKLGDVVTLKSHPDYKMTVGGPGNFSHDFVMCYWFDVQGNFQNKEIYLEALQKSE